MWLRNDQSFWGLLPSLPSCLSARISGLNLTEQSSLNFMQASGGNTAYTEDLHRGLAKWAQQFPEDEGCLQFCLLCTPPYLTEFPAYRRLLILVLKQMTLSVVLLKFVLVLVLLTRSNKAFSTISWSVVVLAMPSSIESSGHFLTTYCCLCQGLRLMLAKTNP